MKSIKKLKINKMATPQELAETVNGYSKQQLRQHNQVCSVDISENELGASMEIQNVAAEIQSLTGTDKTTFQSHITTVSGGEKKSHWPC